MYCCSFSLSKLKKKTHTHTHIFSSSNTFAHSWFCFDSFRCFPLLHIYPFYMAKVFDVYFELTTATKTSEKEHAPLTPGELQHQQRSTAYKKCGKITKTNVHISSM